jgi:hypothetical protein
MNAKEKSCFLKLRSLLRTLRTSIAGMLPHLTPNYEHGARNRTPYRLTGRVRTPVYRAGFANPCLSLETARRQTRRWVPVLQPPMLAATLPTVSDHCNLHQSR